MDSYSKLLINEPPLQVLPTLARLIGINEAIILQQIHYLLAVSKNVFDGKKWVYNSYPDWQKQFPFFSLATIKRTILGLEKLKILITTRRINKQKRDKTKWYSINYEELNNLIVSQTIPPSDQNDPMHRIKMIPSDGIKMTPPLPLDRPFTLEQQQESHHIVSNSDPKRKYKPLRAAFLSKGRNNRKELPPELIDRLSRACHALKDTDFNPKQYVQAHKKAKIPVEIIAYVLDEFIKHKDRIKNFWAYGQTILKRHWPEYNYQEQLSEHYMLKNIPVNIKNILQKGEH